MNPHSCKICFNEFCFFKLHSLSRVIMQNELINIIHICLDIDDISISVHCKEYFYFLSVLQCHCYPVLFICTAMAALQAGTAIC